MEWLLTRWPVERQYAGGHLNQWRLLRGGRLILTGMERMGMAFNTWQLFVWCIWYHSTYSAPDITTAPSSPIKVPPTSCDLCTVARIYVKALHKQAGWEREPRRWVRTTERPLWMIIMLAGAVHMCGAETLCYQGPFLVQQAQLSEGSWGQHRDLSPVMGFGWIGQRNMKNPLSSKQRGPVWVTRKYRNCSLLYP
jgi:hypothetical protein